jgi:hypothetical protein
MKRKIDSGRAFENLNRLYRALWLAQTPHKRSRIWKRILTNTNIILSDQKVLPITKVNVSNRLDRARAALLGEFRMEYASNRQHYIADMEET